MNPMLPVTSMLPLTQQPRKDFIVSDPEKLTYFARANATRAGVTNTWGAFAGLGNAMPETPLVGANGVKAAGAFQTIGDFFGNVGRSLLGGAGNTASPPVTPPPADPTPYVIAGVLGVGVVGFIGYKLWKKR